MIQQGTFRLDLFQRLNTVHLCLPSLRERPEDVVLYANSFLTEFSGEKAFTLTGCGMEALLEYPWPGNVRELRNTIERLVIFNDKRTIDGATVKTSLHSKAAKQNSNTSLNQDTIYSRSEILAVLEQENGNRTRTAARLGVHTVTVQRWLKKFGIENTFSSSPGRPSSLRKSPTKVEA